ncbi:MAG: hypothetical protein Q7T23_18710, partial [Phenylobacterium sp.]|nr:hypothetical protein [Phenylobacterium sp.]
MSTFRVRQDQEAFGGQALDDVAGDFLRGEHPVQALGRAGAAGAQHGGVDALRAEDRNLDALVAVGDGQA